MQSRFPVIDPALNWLLETPFNRELVRSVQAYMEREGMSRTEFGWRAVGDPGFVFRRLHSGCSVKLDTADRVRRFIGEITFRPLLCCELDAFMAVTKVQPWVLGDRSVRQGAFVKRLRAGASPHLATVDRFRRWMGTQIGTDLRRAMFAAVTEAMSYRSGVNGAVALLANAHGSQGGEAMKERPVLLNTKQAAGVVGLSPRTLERMRAEGGGPRFRRISRWVRYLLSDLERWIEECGPDPAPDGRRKRQGKKR